MQNSTAITDTAECTGGLCKSHSTPAGFPTADSASCSFCVRTPTHLSCAKRESGATSSGNSCYWSCLFPTWFHKGWVSSDKWILHLWGKAPWLYQVYTWCHHQIWLLRSNIDPTSSIYTFISSQIQNAPHFTLMTCLQLKTKLRSLYWAQNVFSFSANRSSTSYPIGVPNQESSLIKGGRQKQPANCLGPHSFRKATFIVSGNGKGVACPMHVSFHLTLKPLSHSLTCSQAPTIILHLNQAVCKSRPMDSVFTVGSTAQIQKAKQHCTRWNPSWLQKGVLWNTRMLK